MDLDLMLAGRLERRDFLRYAALLGGAGVLAACKKAEPAKVGPGVTRPSIDQEPGTLQIYDWDGYGNGTYGDDALWKPYAQMFPDAKPKFTVFKDDDSGYAKVAAGQRFDVVHPCGYRFPDWVNLEDNGRSVMQPWDTALIDNFGDLNPTLQQAGAFDGKQYFIVTDWGFAAPMYDSEKVEPTEDSWGILWDERYEGRISWWDSLNMLVVAAYFNGVPNPWDMTDEELEAQKQFLISKVHLVRNFWPIDPIEDFSSGDVWITYAWPFHWVYVKGDVPGAVYMEPKEGRTSWYCGFALFSDSENYHHAHEYVNAWASGKSAIWLLNNYGYGHTNTAIDLSKVDQSLVETLSLDDPTVLDEPRTHVERPIGRRDVYNEIWGEVKAAA